MHAVTFLQDLAVVMIVAAITTVVFRRLHQPVVLGYIIAGVIIGPHTPPYALIHDDETIRTLSELGVILLMFSLGLEFSLRKVKSVGAPALLAAVMEIILLFWVGFQIGAFFEWGPMDRIFLGAMLSMSSTTVIIKVLGDMGRMKESFAQLVFGVLIIEDILGIAMIALLSGIAMTGTLSVGEVGVTLGKLGIFLAVVLVAGLLIVPRLISYVSRFKSNEMLIVTVLGLCFGVSLLAVKLGYSVALGAFIIGAVIAESREIHRIETLIEPVRDMFSAIFFVAIGLLIDPRMLVTHWAPILAVTVAVVVGKVLTCSLGAFLGGYDTRTSLHVGLSLAQIGEFSFIIASLGVTLGVTSSFLYPIAVAVSAITTLLTPYLIRLADPAARAFVTRAPRTLANTLQIYTDWVGQVGGRGPHSLARSLLWKWGAQMALNALLLAGIFLAAAYLGSHRPAWLQSTALGDHWVRTGIWAAALITGLPLIVATVRKLEAFGLLLAEARVTPEDAGPNTAAIRSLIATLIPAAGSVALGLLILLLSSTLLPPLNVLVVLVVAIAGLGWFLSRAFNRVYSSAQAALLETLDDKPLPHAPTPGLQSPLLSDADLDTITLEPGAAAIGHLIRELALRSKTGASIVALERGERRVINPEPDEELLAGDRILLLGSATQIQAAKALLTAGSAAPATA